MWNKNTKIKAINNQKLKKLFEIGYRMNNLFREMHHFQWNSEKMQNYRKCPTYCTHTMKVPPNPDNVLFYKIEWKLYIRNIF
jgi:hypothetical protein